MSSIPCKRAIYNYPYTFLSWTAVPWIIGDTIVFREFSEQKYYERRSHPLIAIMRQGIWWYEYYTSYFHGLNYRYFTISKQLKLCQLPAKQLAAHDNEHILKLTSTLTVALFFQAYIYLRWLSERKHHGSSKDTSIMHFVSYFLDPSTLTSYGFWCWEYRVNRKDRRA